MKKLIITTSAFFTIFTSGLQVSQVVKADTSDSKVTAVIKEDPNKHKEKPNPHKDGDKDSHKETTPTKEINKEKENNKYVNTGFKDSKFLELVGATLLSFSSGVLIAIGKRSKRS